jgi:hypothetical protein
VGSMKQKCIILAFAAIALYCVACVPSAHYGRLAVSGPDMTIQRLFDRWQDYHVSYAGVDVTLPNAILFDPKGDDKTITLHPYWSPVRDREELQALFAWIQSFKLDPPRLYRIVGPDNRVFGYLYTLDTSAHIKAIDDNTLWIDDMTLRPSVKQGIFAPL